MDEDTREFLLAEFELLKDSKQSQIQQEENRFSYFLVFLSALMATVALIVVDKSDYPPLLIVIITFAGFLIGFMTFLRMIHAHINATKYSRGLNRIRDYFITNDPSFEKIADKVLILPRSAEEPKLGEFGVGLGKPWLIGLPGLINIINSILFGISIEILLTLLRFDLPIAMGGITVFVLAYFAHIICYFYTIGRAKYMLTLKSKAIYQSQKESVHG